MEREDFTSDYMRMAEWGWRDDGRKQIHVRQDTRLGEDKLRAPTVSWASIGAQDFEVAREFAKGLQEAADLCEQWNADTGKPRGDVLKA